MSRRAATALHLALFLLGVVLYVVFILPRWWVLTGDIPSTLATAGRLAAGLPIGLAALPVWTMLQQALTPKARTPELALRLRAWSAVLHVVAGVLILLAAIVEIWLSLEAGGRYLFAVYGAAGAIAILAFLALYLSFVAEKPAAEPKPPKPAKAKKVMAEKKPRGKEAKSAAPETSPAVEAETTEAADEAETGDTTEAPGDTTEAVTDTGETPESDAAVIGPVADPVEESQAPAAALRNKRPSGKNRRRLGR